MKTNHQTYSRALNIRSELVDIQDITTVARSEHGPYSCIGCGSELIPRLGEQRVHHFAHKHAADCSGETYLHAAAKHLFVRNYTERLNNNEPFWLEFKRPALCNHFETALGGQCKNHQWELYDLTKTFRKIEIEKGIKGVVADVLLSTEDDKALLIEVAVTHKSERQKLAKQLKMLEITVSREEDLELFLSDKLTERDDRVRAYQLQTRPKRGDLCGGDCSQHLEGLIVYESGKSFLFQNNVKTWMTQSNQRGTAYSRHLGPPTAPDEMHYRRLGAYAGETFKKAIRDAVFKDKAPAKHCYNCKYHGAASIEGTVYCKTYKHSVQNGNNAASCDRYARFRTLEEAELADESNSEWVERRSGF